MGMSDPTTTSSTHTDFASKRLLRLPEVLKIIPVSRSTWYLGVKKREYPAPVNIGRRAVAWRRHEIEALLSTFTDSWSERTHLNDAQSQ